MSLANDPGAIAGIVTACTAVVGAIGTFIYKVRGKSFREILKDLANNQSKDVKELTDVLKTQSTVIKDIVTKEVNKEDKKKA